MKVPFALAATRSGGGWQSSEKTLVDGIGGFPLFSEVRSAGDLFDLDRPAASQQDRAGAFAENHSARRMLKWLDRWRGTKQAPFAVGVAQKPVGFLGTDHQAVIEGVARP